MLEVAASSANLARCFQKKGWRVKAVDWRRKAPISVPHLWADLGSELGQQCCLHAVSIENVLFVLVSPPRMLCKQRSFLQFLRCMITNLHMSGRAFLVEAPVYHEVWDAVDDLWLPGMYLFVTAPCMFGLTARHSTQFLTNVETLQSLATSCDDRHPHLPDHDALRRDAVWHDEFCARVFHLVRDYLVSKEFLVPSGVVALADDAVASAEGARLVQSRRRYFQAVSEYGSLTWIRAEELTDSMKVLSRKRGVDGADLLWVGIYRSPWEFHSEVVKLPFPSDSTLLVPDADLHALSMLLQLGPAGLVRHRADNMKWLLQTKLSMKKRNDELHSTLDPLTARVMKKKDFALLGWLLDYYSYPDVDLVRDLMNGFDLVGEPSRSNVFSKNFTEQRLSATELSELCKWNNRALQARVRPNESCSVDLDLWNQAMDEVDAGWLIPFDSYDQLVGFVGAQVVMSRRFPLQQRDKVRAIDDLSESMVNAAYIPTEKIDLMNIDVMAGLLRVMYRSLEAGRFSWKLRDGSSLSGVVHEAWYASGSIPDVQGRVLDLKNAYKQLCLSPSSRQYAGLWVLDPNRGCAMPFLQVTLPFGACASVVGFNRLSKALWFLGCRIFALCWTAFYDDYGMVEPASSAKSAWMSAEALLTCLGFEYADAPHKRLPFEAPSISWALRSTCHPSLLARCWWGTRLTGLLV